MHAGAEGWHLQRCCTITAAKQRLQQAGLDKRAKAQMATEARMCMTTLRSNEDSDDENVMHVAPQRRRQVIGDSDEDYADMHAEVSTSGGKKRAKVTAASTSRSRKTKR
jgi:hypothetical protein